MNSLSREAFNSQVFSRSKGKCVFCNKPAVDAHHILERKLWGQSGGYFLDNGAAVCEAHHWQCELTQISVSEVRKAAGIATALVPESFDDKAEYDKWGNRVWPSGLRSWGPLEHDTGARKALSQGGVMGLMMPSDYQE